MVPMLLSMWLASAQAADAGSEGATGADADRMTAELMLDAALEDMAAGRLTSGCGRLEALAASYPGSDSARRGAQLAQIINGFQPQQCKFAEGAVEIATNGRTELLVSQGIVWPAWFATAAPVYFPGQGNEAVVGGLIIAGLGAGLGGTYAITQNMEVTTGQALMVYTAELLGGWYGLWVELAVADEFTGRPAHLGVLGGAGLGAVLAWQFQDASAGDVALVRSGAVWGTAIGGLVSVLSETETDQTFLVLGAGTSAGLALTSALTASVELRRGQVNVINLGGYAGALVGGGVAIMASAEAKPAAALVASGALIGLGTGAFLATRDDRQRRLARLRLPTPQVGMLADPDGKLHPGLTMSGRW